MPWEIGAWDGVGALSAMARVGRGGALTQPAALAMEGKCGQRAWLIVEEHLQMLDSGEEMIVMGRESRWWPDGVKPGAQPVEMQAHAAQQGVKGLNRKWPANLPGTGIDGLIGGLTEQRQDGPELRGGGGMPGDGGIEINGKGATAAIASAAIGTEDPLSAQEESGGIGITEPVEEGMQDEKTGHQTSRTSGGAERKKGMRSLSRSERKRGTTMGTQEMPGAVPNVERQRRNPTAALGSAGKARCAEERRDSHGTVFTAFPS